MRLREMAGDNFLQQFGALTDPRAV